MTLPRHKQLEETLFKFRHALDAFIQFCGFLFAERSGGDAPPWTLSASLSIIKSVCMCRWALATTTRDSERFAFAGPQKSFFLCRFLRFHASGKSSFVRSLAVLPVCSGVDACVYLISSFARCFLQLLTLALHMKHDIA